MYNSNFYNNSGHSVLHLKMGDFYEFTGWRYYCFGGWYEIKLIFIYFLLNLYKDLFIMNVMKLLICVQKYQELNLSPHVLPTWHTFFYQI